MTALASMVLTVFTSYLVNPSWFDSGSYRYESTHSTLEECQLVKHGLDAVCAGDSPSHLYVNYDWHRDEDVPEDFNKPMVFTKCDYWAGCYSHRPVTRTNTVQ